jgi:hypothetical protein
MWIRLLKPYAVFFPGSLDPAQSVHSIGDLRGRELVEAGIAQQVSEPPPARMPEGYFASNHTSNAQPRESGHASAREGAFTATPAQVATARAKAKAALASALRS